MFRAGTMAVVAKRIVFRREIIANFDRSYGKNNIYIVTNI